MHYSLYSSKHDREPGTLRACLGQQQARGEEPKGWRQVFSCVKRSFDLSCVSHSSCPWQRNTPDKKLNLIVPRCCCQMLLKNLCWCSCQDSADKRCLGSVHHLFSQKWGNTSSSLKGGKQSLKPPSLVWFNYWEGVPCPIWIKSEIRDQWTEFLEYLLKCAGLDLFWNWGIVLENKGYHLLCSLVFLEN